MEDQDLMCRPVLTFPGRTPSSAQRKNTSYGSRRLGISNAASATTAPLSCANRVDERCFMKKMVGLCLLLVMPLATIAVEDGQVMYAGGTLVKMKEGTLGRVGTT